MLSTDEAQLLRLHPGIASSMGAGAGAGTVCQGITAGMGTIIGVMGVGAGVIAFMAGESAIGLIICGSFIIMVDGAGANNFTADGPGVIIGMTSIGTTSISLLAAIGKLSEDPMYIAPPKGACKANHRINVKIFDIDALDFTTCMFSCVSNRINVKEKNTVDFISIFFSCFSQLKPETYE